MKRIKPWEPWFFLAFGLFHLHRIWALVERHSYASFWIGVLERKGPFYFLLMGLLAGLCLLGIITFFRNLHNNPWWRWIYLFGGGYVLFDLIAIASGTSFWHTLLFRMFDVNGKYWNVIWSVFVLLVGFSFGLGLALFRCHRKQA